MKSSVQGDTQGIGIKQPQHPKLNDEPSVGEFFNSVELSDITVIDNNGKQPKKFQLHRIILASKSTYFRNLFKERPNEKEIVLPTLIKLDVAQTPQQQMMRSNNSIVKDVNIIEAVLKFIYSDYDFQVLIKEGLSSLNCMNFFSYFSTLKVNSGLFLMEKYILQYILNSENYLQILKIGIQFNNQAFQDITIRQVAEKFGKLLQKSSNFYRELMDISYEAFLKIISSQDIQVDNEDIMLSIVHDYILNQNNNLQVETSIKNELVQQQQGISQSDISKNELISDVLPEILVQPIADEPSQQKTENDITDNNANSNSKNTNNSLQPPTSNETENKESSLGQSQNEVSNEQSNVSSSKVQQQNQLESEPDKSKTSETSEEKKEDSKSKTELPSQDNSAVDKSKSQQGNQEISQEDKSKREQISGSNIISQSALNESRKVTFDIQSSSQLGKNQRKGLSNQQIEEILSHIRLGYVSHSVLTHFSQQSIFQSQKDIFYRAISLKLSKYELNTVPNYQGINWNPRESYINKVNILNPAITETQHNVQGNRFASRSNISPLASQVNFQNGSGLLTQQSQQKGNFFSQSYHNEGLQQFVKPNQSGSLVFSYSQDFDENGLLYYLGTKGRRIDFQNPFYLNEVMPFCSSLKQGRIEDLVARLPTNTICTENEKNSFFGFDLGEERYFFPTCYTFRNRSQPSCILYNWILEGSNDNKQWFEIDKRIHFSKDSKYNLLLEKERELLRKPNQSSTWGIDTSKLKGVLKTISFDAIGFRAFRITQLSTNGNNTNEFAIGAIEFYGKAYGMNWEF